MHKRATGRVQAGLCSNLPLPHRVGSVFRLRAYKECGFRLQPGLRLDSRDQHGPRDGGSACSACRASGNVVIGKCKSFPPPCLAGPTRALGEDILGCVQRRGVVRLHCMPDCQIVYMCICICVCVCVCAQVMINRDSWGQSYLLVRGEILVFIKDGLLRKLSPRMFSLFKNER